MSVPQSGANVLGKLLNLREKIPAMGQIGGPDLGLQGRAFGPAWRLSARIIHQVAPLPRRTRGKQHA
jgi:hypothetical protein